jgi:hypothetical protein
MKDERKFSIPVYDKLVERTFNEVRKLGVVKGGEYAGDLDRLANFRRNAEVTGVTMEVVWSVYAGKHWDAVQQYIRDVQSGKKRARAEALPGRVDDLITYLLLFKCMLVEAEGAVVPKAPRKPKAPVEKPAETKVEAAPKTARKPKAAAQPPAEPADEPRDEPVLDEPVVRTSRRRPAVVEGGVL